MYSKSETIERAAKCYLFDTSSSSTTTQTSVSTNTITDSYNQAFTRTNYLSDVGNINLSKGSSGTGPLMLIVLVAGVLMFMFLRKKG